MDSYTVILTIGEVISRTGLSRPTIYRYMKEGRFPQSVPRGWSRNVGWRAADIELYIRNCIANRR